MNQVELNQKYALGGHAQMLADIANFLREGSPYVAQQGAVMDETTAIRQLGKHEGWGAACQVLSTLHLGKAPAENKPVAPYSEPPRVVQPEGEKK